MKIPLFYLVTVGIVDCRVPIDKTIVSSESLYSLTASSLSLVKDFAIFSHDKVIERLPLEVKQKYDEFLALSDEYIKKAKGFFYTEIFPKIEYVWDTVKHFYFLADGKTNQFLSPLVIDFERRYPSQRGRIGKSLLDKFLLIAWLVILFRISRALLRGFMRRVFGRKRQHCKKDEVPMMCKGGKEACCPTSQAQQPTNRLSTQPPTQQGAPIRPSFAGKPQQPQPSRRSTGERPE